MVLYELHSRPEQEKFNESAKVKWKGRWWQQSSVWDECTHKMSKWFSGVISLTCFCFHSHERNVRIFDGNKQDKRQRGICMGVCVCMCVLWDAVVTTSNVLPVVLSL